MKVIARTGIKVPKEGRGFTDCETVQEAEPTAYYLRRIKDGDLLRAPESANESAASASAKTTAKTTKTTEGAQ